MGFREKLDRHGGIVATVAIIAILVGGYIAFNTLSGPPRPTRAEKAFYTTDDGKTWFVDDIKRAPPFKTAEGKEAIGAVVANCGSKPFVLYLWRYTPEGKQEVEQDRTSPSTQFKRELKKPNATAWIKASDVARASTVEAIECPPGEVNFTLVEP